MKLIVTAVIVITCLVVSTVDCFQIDDEYHHHKLARIHRIRKQAEDSPKENVNDPYVPPAVLQNGTNPNPEANSPESVRQSRDISEAGKEEAKPAEIGAEKKNEAPIPLRKLRDVHFDDSAQSEEFPAKEEPRILRRYFRNVPAETGKSDTEAQHQELSKTLRGSRQAPENEQIKPNAQSQEQSKTFRRSRQAPLSGESQSQEAPPQPQALRNIRQIEADQAKQEPAKDGTQAQEQPKALRGYRQAEQPKQESDSEVQPKALRKSRQLPDPLPQKEENSSQEQPKAIRRSRQLPDPQPQKEENPPQEQPKDLRRPRQIPADPSNPQPQKEETQSQEQPKSFRRPRQTPPAADENPSKEASQAQEQPKALRKARQTPPQETQSNETKPEVKVDQPQTLRRSRQVPTAAEPANPEPLKDEAPKQEQPSALRRVRQEAGGESQQSQNQPQPGLRRIRQTEVVEGEMKPSSEEQKTIRKRRDEVGDPIKDAPPVLAPQEQAQAIRKVRQDEDSVGLMDSEESLYDESKEFGRDLRDTLESQEDSKNKEETLPSKEAEQSSLLRLIRNIFDANVLPKRDTVDVSFMEDFNNNNDHYYKLIESRFVRSNDEALLQQAPTSGGQERERFFRYAMKDTPAENVEKKAIRKAIADETIDLVRMLRHADDETQELPRYLQRRSVIIEDDEHGDGHGSSSFF